MACLYFGNWMTVTKLAGFDLEEGFAGIGHIARRGVDSFTVPSPGDLISFSIFVASTTARVWFLRTLSPSATLNFMTLPGMGVRLINLKNGDKARRNGIST
jgi:hypothetical protein